MEVHQQLQKAQTQVYNNQDYRYDAVLAFAANRTYGVEDSWWFLSTGWNGGYQQLHKPHHKVYSHQQPRP
jgi:hypothetical protein